LTFNEIPISYSNPLRLEHIDISRQIKGPKTKAKGDIDADVTTNMTQNCKIGDQKWKEIWCWWKLKVILVDGKAIHIAKFAGDINVDVNAPKIEDVDTKAPKINRWENSLSQIGFEGCKSNSTQI